MQIVVEVGSRNRESSSFACDSQLAIIERDRSVTNHCHAAPPGVTRVYLGDHRRRPRPSAAISMTSRLLSQEDEKRFGLCASGAMWGLSAPTVAPGDHPVVTKAIGAMTARDRSHAQFPPLPPPMTRAGASLRRRAPGSGPVTELASPLDSPRGEAPDSRSAGGARRGHRSRASPRGRGRKRKEHQPVDKVLPYLRRGGS